MDVYLKRYSWTLGVIVTAVCAMLAASGVNHLLEARYLPAFPEVARAAENPMGTDEDGQEPPRRAGLLASNMFCAACPQPSVADVEPDIEPEGTAVAWTSLPLQLVATSTSSNPALSFATIRHRESQRQGAYWAQERIPGGGEIVQITGRYVEFINERTNRLERLGLMERDPLARHEPARAHHPRRGSRGLSAAARRK